MVSIKYAQVSTKATKLSNKPRIESMIASGGSMHSRGAPTATPPNKLH